MTIRIGSVGFLLLLNIQLARILEPEGFGLLSYTLAWVQVLTLFVQFGLPSGLLRSITLAMHEGRSDEVRATLASAFGLMFSLWLGCIAASIGWWLIVGIPRGGFEVIVPALILVLVLSCGPVLAGVMRGMGLVVWSQFPEQILRPGLFCAGLAIWGLSHQRVNVGHALWLQLAMALTSAAVGALLLLRLLPRGTHQRQTGLVGVAHLGLPFLLLAVVQGLSQQATTLMLGHMVSNADVAQFRIAQQMSDALNMLLFGISVVIGPRIIQFYARQDWHGLQHLVVWAHRGGTLLLLAPVVGLVLWGEQFLSLAFGATYTSAYEPMRILLIGRLLYGLVGFSGLVLSMIGDARVAMWNTLAGLVVTLALIAVLVPLWGLKGAAYAVVVGALAINLTGAAYLRKRIGRDLSALKVHFRKAVR